MMNKDDEFEQVLRANRKLVNWPGQKREVTVSFRDGYHVYQ